MGPIKCFFKESHNFILVLNSTDCSLE